MDQFYRFRGRFIPKSDRLLEPPHVGSKARLPLTATTLLPHFRRNAKTFYGLFNTAKWTEVGLDESLQGKNNHQYIAGLYLFNGKFRTVSADF